MSLEQAIIDNTSAVRDLIAALATIHGEGIAKSVAVELPATAAAVVEAKKEEAKLQKAEAKKPEQAAVSTAQHADTQATPGPTAATSGAEVTYEDAKNAILELSKTKGRDAAVAVLSSFGAAKLPDVKPEQIAAVFAAAKKALEG